MKKILFITIIVLISCNVTKLKTKNKYKNVSLIGEWGNAYWEEKRMIIDDDSSIYTFSKTDGGSLLEIGRYINDDTILLDNRYQHTIHVIRHNENEILIDNNGPDSYSINRRITESDYKENLVKYLQQDSVRSKLIGWWKMDKLKSQKFEFPFQEVKEFTINFSKYGTAYSYENHNLNKEYAQDFIIEVDAVNFKSGCVISSHSILELDSIHLKFLYNGDTLHFDRINFIK